jgi:hypothetical protein
MNLVYRPFDFVQHEMIINGVRFNLSTIMKAKTAFMIQKRKSKKLGLRPPSNLVFNLSNKSIMIN